MRTYPKISIVIPAYNEEENIGLFLKELELIAKKFRYEVIVVDDGSTDNTARVVKELDWANQNYILFLILHHQKEL